MKYSQLIRFKVKNEGKYWAVIDTFDDRQAGFSNTFAGAASIAKQLERESLSDIGE